MSGLKIRIATFITENSPFILQSDLEMDEHMFFTTRDGADLNHSIPNPLNNKIANRILKEIREQFGQNVLQITKINSFDEWTELTILIAKQEKVITRDTREIAMKWWNNLKSLEIKFYKTIEANSILMGDRTRHPDSLTGSEIEKIYNFHLNK